MGSLTTCPIGAVKRLVLVQQGLDPVLAGRNLAQALDRITQRASASMTASCPGWSPSTSMPKICWVLGLSLIWNRGSSFGSVESMTSNRPSSGVSLSSGPKLTRILSPSFAVSADLAGGEPTSKTSKLTATVGRITVLTRGNKRYGLLWFVCMSRHHLEVKVGAAVAIGNKEQPPAVGVPGGMIIAGGVRGGVRGFEPSAFMT